MCFPVAEDSLTIPWFPCGRPCVSLWPSLCLPVRPCGLNPSPGPLTQVNPPGGSRVPGDRERQGSLSFPVSGSPVLTQPCVNPALGQVPAERPGTQALNEGYQKSAKSEVADGTARPIDSKIVWKSAKPEVVESESDRRSQAPNRSRGDQGGGQRGVGQSSGV
jgi:hypothetical protein